jgi:hypothetical protein
MSENPKIPKGVDVRPFREVADEWRAKRAADMKALSDSGWTYEQIGDLYGVTRQAVAQMISIARMLETVQA